MTATEQTQAARYRIQRGALTGFVERHFSGWELGMAMLAGLYLGLAIRDDVVPGSIPLGLLVLLSALFAVEFASRCYDAPSRLRYAEHHWLDIVACIPLVGGLRFLRLLRLIRVLRAPKHLRATAGNEGLSRNAASGLWFLLPTLVIVWTSSAAAFWTLEHGSNPHLHSFSDALYWSFLTATTVGHGNLIATTSGGEILTGLVSFVAIGLIGITSSQLTAHWLNTRATGGENQVAEEVKVLQREIVALRSAVLGARDSGGKAE